MPSTISGTNAYDKLLKSVDSLYQIEETNKTDKAKLTSFATFLNENVLEIGKFGRVSRDLEQYLDEYDFSKGFDFEIKIAELQKLHPLRLKLVCMGEAAKSLSHYPDRYGSKKAIEVCKNLTLTCLEKMKVEESEKVALLCESNTNKLFELQKLLERDDSILSQINHIVKKDSLILTKYKTYYADLNKYIQEFPHPEQNDLEIIKKRIAVAKDLDALNLNAEKAVAEIKDYNDRYNKNALVTKYENLSVKLGTSMLFSNAESFKKELIEIEKEAILILNKYKTEPRELELLKEALKSNLNALWKEDSDMLLSSIEYLKNDCNKKDVDLLKIKALIDEKKKRRTQDIFNTTQNNPWIKDREKYKYIHDQLLKRQIKRSTYMANINKLINYKQIRNLGWIPVIGWFILLFQGDFKINWYL